MAVSLLVAPPAQLLTTLARIKAELGITGTADDTQDTDLLLTAMLSRASSAISRYCNRPYGFGQLQVTETIKGSGSQLLGLTYTPVLAITAIYRDTELMTQVDPTLFLTTPNFAEGYYLEDAEAGAVYCAEGWGQTVALLSWGWEAYASRYILPGGTLTQRYTATYTAGYGLPGQVPTLGASPLPGDVEQAALATVKAWWFGRGRDPAIGAERSADEQVTYNLALAESAMLPVGAIRLLRDYRKVIS